VLVAAGIVIGLLVGGVVGVALVRTVGASGSTRRCATRQQLLEDAEREAETMRRDADRETIDAARCRAGSGAMRREAKVEAREEAVRLRAEIEAEIQERRSQVARTEERLQAPRRGARAPDPRALTARSGPCRPRGGLEGAPRRAEGREAARGARARASLRHDRRRGKAASASSAPRI